MKERFTPGSIPPKKDDMPQDENQGAELLTPNNQNSDKNEQQKSDQNSANYRQYPGEHQNQIPNDRPELSVSDETLKKAERIIKLLNENKPQIDQFEGPDYRDKNELKRDKDYVARLKKNIERQDRDKSPEERTVLTIAMAAEAIIALAIRNDEFFSYNSSILSVEPIKITDYDDIVNGVDQAFSLHEKDGTATNFALDVTVSTNFKTIDEKLLRANENKAGQIGRTKIKYGHEVILGEGGRIESEEDKTLNSIPRFTLAFSIDKVQKILEDVELPDDDDFKPELVYTNLNRKAQLQIAIQIEEQAELYHRQLKIENDDTVKSIEKAPNNQQRKEKLALIEKQKILKQKLERISTIMIRQAKVTYSKTHDELKEELIAREPSNPEPSELDIANYAVQGADNIAMKHLINRIRLIEGVDDDIKKEWDDSMDERYEMRYRIIKYASDPESPDEIAEVERIAALITAIETPTVSEAQQRRVRRKKLKSIDKR